MFYPLKLLRQIHWLSLYPHQRPQHMYIYLDISYLKVSSPRATVLASLYIYDVKKVCLWLLIYNTIATFQASRLLLSYPYFPVHVLASFFALPVLSRSIFYLLYLLEQFLTWPLCHTGL